MRLQDALRIRPPELSESDWKEILFRNLEPRLLAEPEVSASIHLAYVHEDLLDGWRVDVGESIPAAPERPCFKCRNEKPKPTPNYPAQRLFWLIVVSLCLKSWLLFLSGLLFAVWEWRPTEQPK